MMPGPWPKGAHHSSTRENGDPRKTAKNRQILPEPAEPFGAALRAKSYSANGFATRRLFGKCSSTKKSDTSVGATILPRPDGEAASWASGPSGPPEHLPCIQ